MSPATSTRSTARSPATSASSFRASRISALRSRPIRLRPACQSAVCRIRTGFSDKPSLQLILVRRTDSFGPFRRPGGERETYQHRRRHVRLVDDHGARRQYRGALPHRWGQVAVLAALGLSGVKPAGYAHGGVADHPAFHLAGGLDRKSTRLNSSHVALSYAAFCLKTKRTAFSWPKPAHSPLL